MDKLIASYGNYSICQLSKSGLLDLAKFVVAENYRRHQKLANDNKVNDDEVSDIYKEEAHFFEHSVILVAKNNKNEIIGSIRLLKWNRKDELPITKLFGITNLDEVSPKDSDAHIWHVGRFAVNADLGTDGILLFRILMTCAATLICRYQNGIMFAECDSKLLKIMKLMGIKAIVLDDGIEYLGSITLPIYITRSGMAKFVARNQALVLNIGIDFNSNQDSLHILNKKISA
jgi:N-acyl-L-homoserine lactone synthetase